MIVSSYLSVEESLKDQACNLIHYIYYIKKVKNSSLTREAFIQLAQSIIGPDSQGKSDKDDFIVFLYNLIH